MNEILNDEIIKNFKIVNTPMSASEFLILSDEFHLNDATRYHRALGRLLFLCSTRPDITFAVYIISQFMQAP